jgi:CheY-like chemotaxis protein
MPQSAAVLCHDKRSLQTLKTTLEDLDTEVVNCPSGQAALELVMTGQCSTLIVDFDLPGADEVIRMASLLPPAQKPTLLAIACRAWPGTGQAFQSGASRILYRPVEPEQIKEAIRAEKKAKKSNRRFPASALTSASMVWPCKPQKQCRWPRTWPSAASCPAPA